MSVFMRSVRKTVCLVAACAAAVMLSSQLSAQAPAAAGSNKKAPPPPPETARVLDLSATQLPIVIDQPGYYRLDRNWSPDHQGAQGAFLDIRAHSVVLDFRGYLINVLNEGPAVRVSGSSVTLRNGGVVGGDDQGVPLDVQGSKVTIENMGVGGLNASYLGGDSNFGLVIRDSGFSTGVFGIPPGSTLERNSFACGFQSGVGIGSETRVTDNVWAACENQTLLVVEGSGNLIERNVFGPTGGNAQPSVVVNGRRNLLRDNTLQVDGNTAPVIQVNNGANVLEANIVMPTVGGERATVGILFTADGNFSGNNRIGALVPVDVGATIQTDWNGNVGF